MRNYRKLGKEWEALGSSGLLVIDGPRALRAHKTMERVKNIIVTLNVRGVGGA